MSGEATEVETPTLGKWFVPSLIISFLAVGASGPILRLFAVDIAKAFQVPVGVATQLSTVNSVGEVVIALLMGFLVVRFRHKSLLLVGVLLVAISALGSYLSPTLNLMLFFFTLEGIGTIMVGVIGLTLIGDSLALKKKSKVVGYVMATTALASLIGVPMISLIANVAGWRSIFLLFVLPMSVTGLALAFLGVPSGPKEKPVFTGKNVYIGSFKQVLMNKSAAFSLLGLMLMSSVAIGLYTVPFFMQRFLLSRDWAAVFLMVVIAVVIVVTIVAGRLVNRFGRKNLTVVGALGSSILAIPIFFMPNLWAAIAVDLAHVGFAYVGITAFACYALEQVPNSRGTMMSMRSIFGNVGDAIGAAIGGVLLVLFSFNLALSYQAVGLVFGSLGITASAIFYFLTTDPTQQH